MMIMTESNRKVCIEGGKNTNWRCIAIESGRVPIVLFLSMEKKRFTLIYKKSWSFGISPLQRIGQVAQAAIFPVAEEWAGLTLFSGQEVEELRVSSFSENWASSTSFQCRGLLTKQLLMQRWKAMTGVRWGGVDSNGNGEIGKNMECLQ